MDLVEIRDTQNLIDPEAKCLLNITEFATGYLFAFPCIAQNATLVMNCLLLAKTIFPGLKRVVADNGAPFVASQLQSLSSDINITLSKSSSYYPQGNGLIERRNKEFKLILKNLIYKNADMLKKDNNQQHWIPSSKAVVAAATTFNLTPSTFSALSPYYLLTGDEEVKMQDIRILPLTLATPAVAAPRYGIGITSHEGSNPSELFSLILERELVGERLFELEKVKVERDKNKYNRKKFRDSQRLLRIVTFILKNLPLVNWCY